MKLRLRPPVLLAAAVLACAGCRKKPFLKPVGDAGTAGWSNVITMPVLKARFKLTSGKKLFRDDGMYEGTLAIHTKAIEAEFPGQTPSTSGRLTEGLLTEVTRTDGVRCLAIYGLATGNSAHDGGRREGLRARAVLKLGMRRELEAHLRRLGINMQFQPLSDEDIANLVEIYSLSKLGFPLGEITNLDKRKFIPVLQACGVIKEQVKPRKPW